MVRRWLVRWLIAAIAVVQVAKSQIGTSLCACQPSVYTFQFNFSSICNIDTINGPGIKDADCFARGFTIGDPVNDTVPVNVNTVTVMELDINLRVIAQTPYREEFRDGDTFTYTSIASSPEGVATLSPERWPGGIQLDIVGVNQNEEPITNVWIIVFENDCGIYPILEIGDTVGWTNLYDIQRPHSSVCPIAMDFPTGSPSLAPSIANDNVVAPTETPSIPESIKPSHCLPRPPKPHSNSSKRSGKENSSKPRQPSDSKPGKGIGSSHSSKTEKIRGSRNPPSSRSYGHSSKVAVASNSVGEYRGSSKRGESTGQEMNGIGKGGDTKKMKNDGKGGRELLRNHIFYRTSLDATGRGVGNRPVSNQGTIAKSSTSAKVVASEGNLPFCEDLGGRPKKKSTSSKSRGSKLHRSKIEKRSKKSKSSKLKARISTESKDKGGKASISTKGEAGMSSKRGGEHGKLPTKTIKKWKKNSKVLSNSTSVGKGGGSSKSHLSVSKETTSATDFHSTPSSSKGKDGGQISRRKSSKLLKKKVASSSKENRSKLEKESSKLKSDSKGSLTRSRKKSQSMKGKSPSTVIKTTPTNLGAKVKLPTIEAPSTKTLLDPTTNPAFAPSAATMKTSKSVKSGHAKNNEEIGMTAEQIVTPASSTSADTTDSEMDASTPTISPTTVLVRLRQHFVSILHQKQKAEDHTERRNQ